MVLNANKKRKCNDGRLFYYLVFALPILQFCIFYIGVNFNSILLAFKRYDSVTGDYSIVWFDNFKTFFQNIKVDPSLNFAIKNSLLRYVLGLGISMPLSLIFSYYIFKKKFAHKTLQCFLFLPNILSSIVMCMIFMQISGHVFPAIGLKDYLANIDTRFMTIVFFNIWVGFGAHVLLYSSAMGGVSPSIIDAAQVDGANALCEFLFIVLPMIFPTISTFLITGIAGIFIDQANLYSFYSYTADPSTYTVGYYLFTQIVGKASGYASYPYAASAGLVCTIIAAPLTLLVKWLLEKYGPSEG